jgi:hypothetical protein
MLKEFFQAIGEWLQKSLLLSLQSQMVNYHLINSILNEFVKTFIEICTKLHWNLSTFTKHKLTL